MAGNCRFMTAEGTREALDACALFLFVLFCGAYALRRWADWNQNSRFDLTVAIVDHRTLSIDCCVANTGEYALYEGRTYSDKAPGLSLLAVPAYLLWRTVAALPPAVGARPPRSISALARPGSGINVTGYVSDPTPYLQRAGAFIVPLRAGSGMRVKILDALAHGLPVVTTAAGCAGIDVEPGRDLLVADTREDFAAAVLRVLNDGGLAAELGASGRRFVETHHDDRAVCRRLAPVYEQALQRLSHRAAASPQPALSRASG
jgi:hypothetical protein